MIKLSNIKLPLDTDFSNLNLLCAGAAGIDAEQVHSARLARRSLDARRKGSLHYICSFTFCCRDEAAVLKRCPSAAPCVPYSYTPKPILRDMSRPSPVIAGFGPAGMFCALTLARAGLKPIVLERGRAVEQRVKDVKDFWQTGRLNTRSNVQFGEGGAGTFSDGKLTTGIKDPRCHLVLEDMVRHGAPEELLYDAKPHVGTDRLTGMVKSIRKEIIQLGGKVLFEHCLTGLKLEQGVLRCITAMSPDGEKQLECDTLVLALGHSARDTFAMLYETGLPMEQKPVSVGVRIEHPQSFIDRAQYGDLSQYGPFTGRNIFPAADYKLSVHLPQGGCYTFCMCPGGQVVAAASEEEIGRASCRERV